MFIEHFDASTEPTPNTYTVHPPSAAQTLNLYKTKVNKPIWPVALPITLIHM